MSDHLFQPTLGRIGGPNHVNLPEVGRTNGRLTAIIARTFKELRLRNLPVLRDRGSGDATERCDERDGDTNVCFAVHGLSILRESGI